MPSNGLHRIRSLRSFSGEPGRRMAGCHLLDLGSEITCIRLLSAGAFS
jgi:hypothetical protein